MVNAVILKRYKMNSPPMKDFTPGPEVAVDGDGRLFDQRVRTMLDSLVGPESGRRLETFAAMRWLMSRTHQFMERSADQYGLSEGRLQVLMRLRHQGDCPLGGLAEAMHVSARNITGLVDHLERDGLVVRVPDPEDRRSVRAHLTEQGQRLIERIWKEFMQRSLALVEDLPQEDLDLVRHTCLQLIQRIESQLNQDGAATATQRSNPE
jgi:DNA-binding MarR family transcriptional regulator